MSLLTLIKPILGKPDATEDVKLVNALTAIEAWANGQIDHTNLTAAAGILGSQVAAATIAESNLTEALQALVNAKVAGLAVTTQAGNYVAKPGDLVLATGAGKTITVPVTLNAQTCVFCAQAGETTVEAASGVIVGDFTDAASCKLASNQHLLLVGDGTNARIIAGEPKREQEYSAAVGLTREEAEAGHKPSSTCAALVVFSTSTTGEVTVDGVRITSRTPVLGAVTFEVLPGQVWKANVGGEYSVLLK